MASQKLTIGQRVWVLHPGASGKRAYGRIASISAYGPAHGFVVTLDGTPPTVVSCDEDGRGRQWDFAEEDEA